MKILKAEKVEQQYKCTRCKHECVESDKVRKINKKGTKELGVRIADLVCPKCGCADFYLKGD
jgi:hypothetical protein